jgi:hypothetical protein
MAIERARTSRAEREAKSWWEKLGQRSITTAEVRAFAAWRDDPANDAAYSKLEAETPRTGGRYAVLPSPGGFSVIDTFTGEPASFATARQVGISVEDANEIADVLNLRHAKGVNSH